MALTGTLAEVEMDRRAGTPRAVAEADRLSRQLTLMLDADQLRDVDAFAELHRIKTAQAIRVLIGYGSAPARRHYVKPTASEVRGLNNRVTYSMTAAMDADVRAFGEQFGIGIGEAVRVMINYGLSPARRRYRSTTAA